MGRTGDFLALPWIVQLGHITAELTRARVWRERGDELQCREAIARLIELLGIFVSGRIPSGLRHEMLRLEEIVAQFYGGPVVYAVSLADLERYLLDLFLIWHR